MRFDMPRDPDWRTRHCAEPAMEAVAEARGVNAEDLWTELGGCPRSWKEAAATFRRLGVRTLRGAVTAFLGPEIDRRQAARGDIVMTRGGLGICRGDLAECCGATVKMREVVAAWKAGGHG